MYVESPCLLKWQEKTIKPLNTVVTRALDFNDFVETFHLHDHMADRVQVLFGVSWMRENEGLFVYAEPSTNSKNYITLVFSLLQTIDAWIAIRYQEERIWMKVS